MQPAASNDSYKRPKLSVVAGVSPVNPTPNQSCKPSKLVRSPLINAERCSYGATCHPKARRTRVSPCCHGQQRQSASTRRGGYSSLYLAIIAAALCSVIPTQAQERLLAPRTGQPGITIEEVIVTGSNIPTAEEVGPNPVDTYRPADIEKLGIRNATDLATFLPQQAGGAVNLNFGATAVYGSDAIAGVVNFFLVHKFRGLEIGGSYGNTNLGASNDMGEWEAWI